jgi:hypothetical protein
VCTYQTSQLAVRGSAKGGGQWFAVREATVYVDHPAHSTDDHTLNIDVRNGELGPSARLALELDAASARALAEAIVSALEAAPAGLLAGSPPSQRA